MIEYIKYIIGFEVLVCCVIILIDAYWQNKLRNYLKMNHANFYKIILEVPFLAGNQDVFNKQYLSFWTYLWGKMPDNMSSIYQIKYRFYYYVGITCFIILVLTMLLLTFILPIFMRTG